MPEMTYNINNNWFAIGNSGDHVNKFLAGGNNKQAFADKISGHPFGGYIDIQKLLKSMDADHTDSSGKVLSNASLKMWQDVVITGGEYKNGALAGEVEINFMDKNTNSLKQLSLYFEQLSKMMKSWQSNPGTYLLDTVPPVETPTTEN
jgi:hypothetical protein